MKTKTAMIGIISIFLVFLGCDKNPVGHDEEEKHFWKFSGLSEVYVSSLVSANNTILAGASGDGMRISYNNGKDWETPSFSGWYSGDMVNTMAIGLSEKNTVWINSEAGLFKVYPSTWYAEQTIKTIYILSVAQDNNDVVFASGNGNDGPVFLKSTTEGETWRKITVKHPAHKQEFIGKIFIDTDQAVYAGGESRIFISSDHGKTWTWTESFYPMASSVSSIVRAPNGNLVVGPYEGGIFYSENNGEEWNTSYFSSWDGVEVYDLVTADRFYAGTNIGVLVSDDNGKTWTESNDGLETEEMVVESLTLNSGYLFAGTDSGIFRSTEPIE